MPCRSDRHGHVAHLGAREPLQLGEEHVPARRQRVDTVAAVRLAHGGPQDAAVRVPDGDDDAGEDAAVRVRHGAGDGAAARLGRGGRGQEQRHRDRDGRDEPERFEKGADRDGRIESESHQGDRSPVLCIYIGHC